MTMTESELQAKAGRLVQQEVHYCVSFLVSTLAAGNAHGPSDLRDLCEQAGELAAPTEDWQEAAQQEGWNLGDDGNFWKWTNPRDTSGDRDFTDNIDADAADGWQRLCEEKDIEPYQWEVFEHWIVSDWLADALIAKGERVDKDFGGMIVWGRTTTGQSISMDSVIRQITAELHAAT